MSLINLAAYRAERALRERADRELRALREKIHADHDVELLALRVTEQHYLESLRRQSTFQTTTEDTSK